MTPNKLQKIELTRIGKGEEPKLEPRILIEQPEYSYEFGRDYSLNIENMPAEKKAEDLDYPVSETEIPVSKPAKKDKRSVQEINVQNKKKDNNMLTLFD